MLRKMLLKFMAGTGALFMLAGAVLGLIHQAQIKDRVPVEGVIAAIEWEDPLIEYAVDGQVYRYRSHMHAPWLRVGGSWDVYVNPADPSDAVDHTLRTLCLFFACMGAVMLAAGAVVYLVMARNARRREQILIWGTPTQGVVTEMRQSRYITIGNRRPWYAVVSCMHPITGESMMIRSHQLWEMALQPGDRVQVCFDPQAPKRWAVDIGEESGQKTV